MEERARRSAVVRRGAMTDSSAARGSNVRLDKEALGAANNQDDMRATDGEWESGE